MSRNFVALVAGQCSSCGRLVRSLVYEAMGFFEIDHHLRGGDNYTVPSLEAVKKGCVSLIKSILTYLGDVKCKKCHKRDEDTHPERGQDAAIKRVNTSCAVLHQTPGSLHPPCLSPKVSFNVCI